MDTDILWNFPPMETFQPDATMPPIPEVDYDAAWTDPGNHFLPLTPYAPETSSHAAATNAEIANLAGQVQQLQANMLEMGNKTQASLSELNELVNRWSRDTDKRLVHMLKDIVNLDRNYLKLMPWCYQVHERVSEFIAEKESRQPTPSVKD
jgi:hypothetical protein